MSSYVNVPRDPLNPTNAETKEIREERQATVRALYESGIPFYTKKGIQDIQQQINVANRPGYPIYVKGVDGRLVRLETERDPQLATGELGVWFDHLQGMLQRPNYPGPYCSMRFAHTSHHMAPQPAELILGRFDSHRASWEESPVCRRLREKLCSTELRSGIKKIIGISLGTMGMETAARCYQHALLLTLRDIVRAIQPDEPDPVCFVQDPAYSAGDEMALFSRGITVLHHPNAFLEVDESSIVVSFSSNVPVKQVVLDIARPAVIIWDDYSSGRSDEEISTDPDSPRTRKIYETCYDSSKLDEGEMLRGVTLRIRREDFVEVAPEDAHVPSENSDRDPPRRCTPS